MNHLPDKEFEVARKVLTLANRIVSNRNQHLKELDITAEQADSLLFFSVQVNSSITMLKDYLDVSHQTARGIVNRMEHKNLITLLPSKTDGRFKVITLTQYGKNIVSILKRNGTNTGTNLLMGLNQEEQDQFIFLISTILNNTK